MAEEQKVGLIYQKIPEIMSKIGAVGKDKKNQMQGYMFRGIDDMYNTLSPILSECGVFATSKILSERREERKTKKSNGQEGLLLYTVLTMRFRFYATDGSFVTSQTIGEAMDSGDKASNKAMSVAYKYALMQIFCIRTEEIKDPEHDDPQPLPKQQQPKTASTTQNTIDWDALQEWLEEKKSKLTASRVVSAQKIIDAKDTSRYAGLLEFLKKLN